MTKPNAQVVPSPALRPDADDSTGMQAQASGPTDTADHIAGGANPGMSGAKAAAPATGADATGRPREAAHGQPARKIPAAQMPAGAQRGYKRPLITDASAARWLLAAVLLASIYFFHGFLVPVLAAMIIVFASWPALIKIQSTLSVGRITAAALAVLLIVGLLIVPITLAIVYAFGELKNWVSWGIQVNAIGADPPRWIADLPQIGAWAAEQWTTYIGKPGAIGHIAQVVSGENIGSIYRGVLAAGSIAFHLVLTLLFMLIALFIFYRDGEKIAAQIDRVGQRILPNRWERVSRVVPVMISATVTGMALIAIAEGMVLGTAYWIAGVPSPVTLGVITGFMALIPGGAPLCFTLVSIYLVASGTPYAGLGLLLWGTMELFIVDKTVRPVLVGGPAKLPFLPTFFGLVGGVKTMGIVGLFIGPVLMALLVTMWREWQREISRGADASATVENPAPEAAGAAQTAAAPAPVTSAVAETALGSNTPPKREG